MNYNIENLDGEIWKDVLNFEGLYQISSFFRVKSIKENIIMKTYISNRGYVCIKLFKNGKYYTNSIHRLFALAFIPNPLNLPEVNHLDGNKLFNDKLNLVWSTESDNILHGFKLGLLVPPRGEKCGTSKLKNDEVLKMREMYKTGKFTFFELGNIFKIHLETVRNIIKRKTWKYI